MQYSILLPYHNRYSQWNVVLSGLSRLYAGRGDVEVCLVVDWKSKQEWDALEALHARQQLKVRMEMAEVEDNFNPAPLYNQAARLANGRFLVLSSPEVAHKVDVLGGFDREFYADPHCYVVASCESLCADGKHHMWYQHSHHRDKRYHFCAAILAESYAFIGGFDEEYGPGVAYDDDDWLARIRSHGVREVVRDDLLTAHMFHRKPYEGMARRRILVERNRRLYQDKWGKELPL